MNRNIFFRIKNKELGRGKSKRGQPERQIRLQARKSAVGVRFPGVRNPQCVFGLEREHLFAKRPPRMPRAIERLAAGKNRNTTAGRGGRHGKRLFANGMFPGSPERRAIAMTTAKERWQAGETAFSKRQSPKPLEGA